MTESYVYRCRNSDGDVIYIGSTIDLDKRVPKHRTYKPWWPEVATIDTETYSNLASARAAEAAAILAEQPRYNQLGLTAPKPRVGRRGNRPLEARMPAAVRALIAFYGSIDAVESTGIAYRFLGEWVVTDAGKNIAANVRDHI